MPLLSRLVAGLPSPRTGFNTRSVCVGFLVHKVTQGQILLRMLVQGDTKKRELLKNPTKTEEIQEKKLLTEIEPLQLAF